MEFFDVCEKWRDDTLFRVYPCKKQHKQQNGGKNNEQEQST